MGGIEYIAFVLLAFASSLVSAVFGLGTALLLLSLGALVLPIKEAIALATLMFLVAGITKTLLFRGDIDWRVAAWVTIGSLPFAYIGAGLVDTVPAELLKKMLGIMLLCYLLVNFSGWQLALKKQRSGLFAGACLYGFLSGLLGSGNIIKAILFRGMSLDKEAFVGIMAATSVLTNIAKLIAYSKDGLIGEQHIYVIPALIISAVSAALVGRYLLQKISIHSFQHGVSVVLACAAISLLAS